MLNRIALPAAALALATLGQLAPAQAAPELITNGNFEQTSITSSQQFTGAQVTGWANATTSGYTGYGYNFLVLAGTADTTGFTSLAGNHNTLWGPGGGTSAANYSNNGLTAASPVGGNYIVADGDSNFRGGISQTLSNLTIGANYLLTFYWAGAQFDASTTATTEAWQVTFGSATQSTGTDVTASKGFTAWTQTAMTFTATAVTQTLTFLAIGTPNGAPPSSLLDGVSLTQVTAVPEPGTIGLLLAGLAGVTALGLKRRASKRGA